MHFSDNLEISKAGRILLTHVSSGLQVDVDLQTQITPYSTNLRAHQTGRLSYGLHVSSVVHTYLR